MENGFQRAVFVHLDGHLRVEHGGYSISKAGFGFFLRGILKFIPKLGVIYS